MLTMKKHLITLLTLFTFAALTAVSCKKDDTTDPGAPDSDYFVSYKADGKSITVDGETLAFAKTTGDQLGIYGVQAGSTSLLITIKKNLTTGNHLIKAPDAYANFTDENKKDFSTAIGNGAGVLMIEEYDATHIKGTFQFNGYNSTDNTLKAAITEGKFNVKID